MSTIMRNSNVMKHLLTAGLLLTASLGQPVLADGTDVQNTDQVIQPEVSRRDVKIPKIKSSDFEVGAYAGIFSIENFGSNPVYGARLSYHVTEDYFIEGVYGRTTISQETYCNLGLCLWSPQQPEQDLTYYAVSLGIDLFPNELFFGRTYAMNSAVYLVAGVGNTNVINENHFTSNIGLGIRVLPRDWLAVHITIRDYLFNFDLLGTNKLTNNFELTGGLSVYF